MYKNRATTFMEDSPIAQAVQKWAELNDNCSESKTTSEWLETLATLSPEIAATSAWPSTPRMLGSELRKVADELSEKDIQCRSLGKSGSSIKWKITSKLMHDIDDIHDIEID